MFKEVPEAGPVTRSYFKAPFDDVLALVGQAGAESHFGVANGFVVFVGNVSTDHVVEEDSQGPDGGLLPVVAGASDPLRGCIDSRTCNHYICKMRTLFLTVHYILGDACC